MISIFSPRWVKQAKDALKSARKVFRYNHDRLNEKQTTDFKSGIEKLRESIRRRDKPATEKTVSELEKQCATFLPANSHSAWSQNCEVFLVAILIALGVRTYFIQPFTIPTGSMQPTLNGIIGYPTKTPAPNPFVRLGDYALFGRNYVNIVANHDETVVGFRQVTQYRFFHYTQIVFDDGSSTLIHAPTHVAKFDFKITPGRAYHKGEIIAHGYVNTGDHVFVDKVAYNFRRPWRGEVFVFTTLGIATPEQREDPNATSEFYIKRIGGLPGDLLQIKPPELFVNGKLSTAFGFRRNMACKNGYKGYSNKTWFGSRFRYLGDPSDTFRVPEGDYFALGDNSYDSDDSRDWGVVPEKNVVGDALFVYWPFTSHWGLIR